MLGLRQSPRAIWGAKGFRLLDKFLAMGVLSPANGTLAPIQKRLSVTLEAKLTVQVWYPTLDESMARIRYGSLLPAKRSRGGSQLR